MAYNRFDHEQQIMTCWNVTEDLKALSEAILEMEMSKDEIVNILIGMELLYNTKFNKLWGFFEESIKAP